MYEECVAIFPWEVIEISKKSNEHRYEGPFALLGYSGTWGVNQTI